jgi:hypothetical protein
MKMLIWPTFPLERSRKTRRVWLPAFLGVICLGTAMTIRPRDEWSRARGAGTQPLGARLADPHGKLPLSFETNQGQTDPHVSFLSRGQGYTLFLAADEAVLMLRGASQESRVKSRQSKVETGNSKSEKEDPGIVNPSTEGESAIGNVLAPTVLRTKLLGANSAARVTGLDELPGKSHYFIGNDPRKWRTNVPNYARVRYEEIYPGIDLVYYGKSSVILAERDRSSGAKEPGQGGKDYGQLEYDFVVAPGADPRTITLQIETGNLKLKDRNSKSRNRQFPSPEFRVPKPSA